MHAPSIQYLYLVVKSWDIKELKMLLSATMILCFKSKQLNHDKMISRPRSLTQTWAHLTKMKPFLLLSKQGYYETLVDWIPHRERGWHQTGYYGNKDWFIGWGLKKLRNMWFVQKRWVIRVQAQPSLCWWRAGVFLVDPGSSVCCWNNMKAICDFSRTKKIRTLLPIIYTPALRQQRKLIARTFSRHCETCRWCCT